jgi:hypothetical protein
MIGEDLWQQYADRLGDTEAAEVLRGLFETVIERLAGRIDQVRDVDGKAIAFFSARREIVTINVMRRNLRLYVHPAAGAYFDGERKYGVQRISFWESSLHKKTGRFRGLSVWVSKRKFLRHLEKIIKEIPATTESDS